MVYGDLCTGLSAATVAWHPLGWMPAWFSEIEPFPCRVLKHHYPHVPNLGDMLLLQDNKTFLNATIDLMVGGTPCQSFSLAGLRGGLADVRGNLALQYCRLLKQKQPRWFVWENVPGALSSFSNETEKEDYETSDFSTILSAFRECGYSVAYRVLDAQYFGVPQRRRRVYVVGYLGNDWRPPAAVLFESQSSSGNNKKIKEAKQSIAGTITTGIGRRRGAGIGPETLVIEALTNRPYSDRGSDLNLLPCFWDGSQISQTLDAVLYKGQTMPEKNRFPAVLQSLYFEPRIARNGRGRLDNVAAPLKAESGTTGKGDSAGMVLYSLTQITGRQNRSNPQPGDMAPTISQGDAHNIVIVPAVRRLTPLECERLQGFPDNYTDIPGAKDSPRYKSLGNSMAVPVMRWIGNRIDIVDKYLHLEG